MPVITGGLIAEGLYEGYTSAGVPSAGTDAVQTLTVGGTPSGGTFTLAHEGFLTTAIPWNATNATLIASIDSALEALPSIGTGGVATTAGTVTAGIGTILLTFSGGNRTKQPVTLITVAANNMTGTSPTVAVATTTPGVAASARGAAIGAQLTDITNGKLYINTGTPNAPTWTVVGAQT